MHVHLANNVISISISSIGAELKSLKHNNIEYIWNANPNYWSYSSPVLFPIIAKQKNDYYNYKNNKFTMPMHGFAKDSSFVIDFQSKTQVKFTLTESKNTLLLYPFKFILSITYTLKDNQVLLNYSISNNSSCQMPFSIGGHTGYNIPVFSGDAFSDYSIRFEKKETAPVYLLLNKLLSGPTDYLKDQNFIKLSSNTFNNGALIFRSLTSNFVSIVSELHGKILEFDISNFKNLGIWSLKEATFVCIEPWAGLPSAINDDQDIFSKQDILTLNPFETKYFDYSIKVF